MSALRCLALDADAPALAELTYLLSADQRVTHVAPARDIDNAATLIGTHQIDVVFVCLIHHAPQEVNTVLAQLENRPDFVALSRNSDFAVDAFEFGALDYILKPITPASIDRALTRASQSLSRRTPSQPATVKNRIAVDIEGIQHLIDPADVLYVEAFGDYTTVMTTRGPHLSRHSLSTLAEQLEDAGFMRVHRSWLVALPRVDAISSSDGQTYVTVANNQIPVARRCAREVKLRLL
jgi:DNA-binding LytR/AlgR family response regulator